METAITKDRLFTRGYISVCIASFLTSFSFFLLVPTLPFYLTDVMGVQQEQVGVLLSCYVVAVLCVRPFAGCIADIFPRKNVYVTAFALFALAFTGYQFISASVTAFVILRIFHGFAFGSLTTTANTLVIDIMPSSRRGEGLGYYGVMNNLAMAFGPMTGLFIIEAGHYTWLFAASLAAAASGLCLAISVKAPARPTLPLEKAGPVISTDRFFLKAGIPACITLTLLAVPYGMTTSYIAIYAGQSGIVSNQGLFFTVMAFGLIVSRLNSGKMVDRGMITETIRRGMYIGIVGISGEALLAGVAGLNITAGYALYFLSALLIGYGFGTMFPAFNTLFVNMAPNSRRATANATYLTGWDVGIGIGMLAGSTLAAGGFAMSFAAGTALVAAATVFFVFYVTRHFQRHRLR